MSFVGGAWECTTTDLLEGGKVESEERDGVPRRKDLEKDGQWMHVPERRI